MISFYKATCRFSFPAVVLMCVLVLLPNSVNARDIFLPGPSENQCRVCHGDLKTFPQLEKINPNRHHQLIGKHIVGLGYGSHDTVAPGDTSTGEYSCMTCHSVYNQTVQRYEMKFTRDCLVCHIESSVTTSPGSEQNVHHFTKTWAEGRCKECHESLLATINKNLVNTYDKLSDSQKANWSYDYGGTSSNLDPNPNLDEIDPNKVLPAPNKELADKYKLLREYYDNLKDTNVANYYKALWMYYK